MRKILQFLRCSNHRQNSLTLEPRTSRIIHGFTDYPFTAIGDNAGEPAPFRNVRVISYDGRKYCEIIVEYKNSDDETCYHYDTIKCGYVYTPLTDFELEILSINA